MVSTEDSMQNKIYELTDEQFIILIKESTTISEVLFKLGYTINGNSWGVSQVRQRMTDLHLDQSNFKGKNILAIPKVITSKLFSSNSKHTRKVIRSHIIKNNLIPYKCAICGVGTWQDKILSLELDHINGINNDNRIENLRFLCPNCHSQTSTYGSKNRQLNESKYDITDKVRILVENTYKDLKNIKKVSAKLGIRQSVVNKIVIESGQKHTNQKYVIRYDSNHKEIKRYGSLVEAAKDLITNNEVKTKSVKTCTRTITYNKDNFWLNSYWKILDACEYKLNPL